MVKNLKALRNKMGVSQQAVADTLGVSQQSINRYENHKVEPDITLLISMADFFGVTVDYLIGRTEEDGNNSRVLNDELFYNKYESLPPKERHYIESIIDIFAEKS